MNEYMKIVSQEVYWTTEKYINTMLKYVENSPRISFFITVNNTLNIVAIEALFFRTKSEKNEDNSLLFLIGNIHTIY